MTSTDEVRRGLRELGVQYQACGDSFTTWKHDGKTATYAEYPEGGKLKAFVTPEQAIAATVGRGTCHIKEVASYGYPFECSVCKAWYGADFLRGELRFCPNCGAEVVDE